MKYIRICCMLIGIFIILAGLLWWAAPAQASLPPRPTPKATVTPIPTLTAIPPSKPVTDGGMVELHVKLGQIGSPVQSLWTIVQWQDGLGDWHNVEGWQGALDQFAGGEGQKAWWVAQSDLGKGPFRWLIYEGYQGRLAAASLAFYLPQTRGQKMMVEVSLTP